MNAPVSLVVSVRFFASLREATGHDQLDLDLENPSISALRSKLASQLDDDALRALTARGVQVCVNQTIVRDDIELRAGDEVAFLPPVTGG